MNIVSGPGKVSNGAIVKEVLGNWGSLFCNAVHGVFFSPQLTGLSEYMQMGYLTSSIQVMPGHLCKQKHCFPTATYWWEVRCAFFLKILYI